ncbi:MAG: DUF333 domain-containing protein [Candidatus Paceibacterota bacterium]|nr:DUF333 domain-containing protein [bacterium]
MNKKISFVVTVLIIIVGIFLYWYQSQDKPKDQVVNIPQSSSNIVNPASVYCKDNGGTLKIEKKPDGSEYALCYFDDNRACEKWAMMRGDCPIGGRKTTGYDTIAQNFCAWSGGSTLAEENAKCIFSDGSVCLDEDFYMGKCQKGDSLKK